MPANHSAHHQTCAKFISSCSVPKKCNRLKGFTPYTFSWLLFCLKCCQAAQSMVRISGNRTRNSCSLEPNTKATKPAFSSLLLAFLSALQTHFPTLTLLWLLFVATTSYWKTSLSFKSIACNSCRAGFQYTSNRYRWVTGNSRRERFPSLFSCYIALRKHNVLLLASNSRTDPFPR